MQTYQILLYSMAALGLVVFICLFFVKAGYGYLSSAKWGPVLNNKLAWILMEAPAFFCMLFYTLRDVFGYSTASNNSKLVLYIIAGLFLLHYFQRTFIFPLLMRGKGTMPIAVMLMGMVFNCLNSWFIGKWLFTYAPDGFYPLSRLGSWQFILGTLLFFAGMFINLQSDHIIRSLRAPGDNKHYIPRKGMYKYVTSANYFGEIVEWLGFAVLSWSSCGFLFFFWTFCNLAPRSKSLTQKYEQEFGDEYRNLHKKNLIPFIW